MNSKFVQVSNILLIPPCKRDTRVASLKSNSGASKSIEPVDSVIQDIRCAPDQCHSPSFNYIPDDDGSATNDHISKLKAKLKSIASLPSHASHASVSHKSNSPRAQHSLNDTKDIWHPIPDTPPHLPQITLVSSTHPTQNLCVRQWLDEPKTTEKPTPTHQSNNQANTEPTKCSLRGGCLFEIHTTRNPRHLKHTRLNPENKSPSEKPSSPTPANQQVLPDALTGLWTNRYRHPSKVPDEAHLPSTLWWLAGGRLTPTSKPKTVADLRNLRRRKRPKTKRDPAAEAPEPEPEPAKPGPESEGAEKKSADEEGEEELVVEEIVGRREGAEKPVVRGRLEQKVGDGVKVDEQKGDAQKVVEGKAVEQPKAVVSVSVPVAVPVSVPTATAIPAA